MLCGSGRARWIVEENGCPIYRCRGCGLVYVYPIPDAGAMKGYYASREGACGEAVWERFSAEVFKRASRDIRKSRQNGSLLDVGCGYGFFMRLMRNEGWNVHGIEIDGEAARHARESLGLDVQQGDVTDYTPRPEEFDLITLWWVLEHLPDPAAAVRACAASLKKGGMILLRVPNIDFILFVYKFRFVELFLARLGRTLAPVVNPVSRKKRFFELLGAPYHLYGYDRRAICAMLEGAGLRDCKIALGGKLRTGRRLRDFLETLLHGVATVLFRLSCGRVIAYHDLTVSARKDG
jgi:2-polyprenyl-3-methyl-5-hydroxy-6-metoxy-1,4-benzoquinol methylase